MAAQTRIINPLTLVDSLKEFAELAALIRDPDAIEKGYAEARKQMQLTEAEAVKTQEAKAFLNKYDNALAELENKHKELEDYRNKTLQDLAQAAERAESLKTTMQEKETALLLQETTINKLWKDLDEGTQAFEDSKVSFAATKNATIKELEKRENKISQTEMRLEESRARVAEKEKLLQQKSEQLKSLLG